MLGNMAYFSSQNKRDLKYFLALVWALSCCITPLFSQTTYYDDGTVRMKRVTDDNGAITTTYYNPEGLLVSKDFIQGERAEESYYFANGKLSSLTPKRLVEYEWKNHGVAYEYFETGKVLSSLNWYKGKRNGTYTLRYENNKIALQGDYEMNKKVGEWNYYYENGSMMEQFNYNDTGGYHGWHYRYNEAGSLTLAQRFENGRLMETSLEPKEFKDALQDIYFIHKVQGRALPWEMNFLSKHFYYVEGEQQDLGLRSNYVLYDRDRLLAVSSEAHRDDLKGGLPANERIESITAVNEKTVHTFTFDDEALTISELESSESIATNGSVIFDLVMQDFSVVDVLENTNDEGENIRTILMACTENNEQAALVSVKIKVSTRSLYGWSLYNAQNEMMMTCDLIHYSDTPDFDEGIFDIRSYFRLNPIEVMDLRL